MKAILNWPPLVNGKAMQRFLRAVNFHREFSARYADIAAPLEGCRNISGKIDWTPERLQAFDKLKQLFADDILLRHIDWKKQFYLTTDASRVGVGAWLGQKDENGVLQPVYCISKKLTPIQQRWPATKLEAWAKIWGG